MISRIGRRAALALLCATAAAALPAAAQDKYIVMASTTSTEQSGLFPHLLPAFRKASGIDVRVVAVGTGQALDMGRRGDAGGLPVAQLGGMGAALVGARHEGDVRCGEPGQRPGDVLALRAGRVIGRADEHEIVVHHRTPRQAEALGDELLFGGLVVHEDDVGVAAPAHVERLAGADRNHAHIDAARLLEGRQQVREKS